MSNVFNYFIRISTDQNDRYYLKSTIDETKNTIDVELTNLKQCWAGKLDQEHVRTLAKKFPTETKDSFYSHTQFAFSKGNQTETGERMYVFSCKRLDKNRLEFVWKEKIIDLNSLKTVGSVELQERPAEEILSEIFDYAIDEIHHQRTINEQRLDEVQRVNQQLNKAVETIQRTVDLKDQLEGDLYRKFVLVLNTKKTQLAKLKEQLDSSGNGHSIARSDKETSDQTGANFDSLNVSTIRSASPTFDEDEHLTKKRAKYSSDEATTSDEEMDKTKPTTHSTGLKYDHRTDSALDLGDDQMDYKASTISKHHHRTKPIPDRSIISTRPFVHPPTHPSSVHTPSLPEDSQTADDMLNKI